MFSYYKVPGVLRVKVSIFCLVEILLLKLSSYFSVNFYFGNQGN